MDRILRPIQDYIVREQKDVDRMRQLADRLRQLAADAERNANFYTTRRK